MIDYIIRFVQHQDIYQKKIKEVKKIDAHKAEVLADDGTYLITDETPQLSTKYAKMYLGLEVSKAQDIIDATIMTKDHPQVRILIFSQDGRKLTHIIPFHFKAYKESDISKSVQSILAHALE